jgi:zinc transport system ATP-binding protein
MNASLVSIHDLRVELGGQPILRGVNAELARSGIAALIGLNGSGKSTLLRTLVKEIPYTGTIAFHCGHDHQHPDPRHVGYVPQKLRIEANLPLTVRDLFGLTLQRRPLFFGVSRHVRERMKVLLERVGAVHLRDAPVDKLSGGELQRILLALALEPDPELLLLDEPAAGIDFQEEEKFYDLIGELNQRTGVTILLVSHDLTMVSRLAHHVLCLEGGRIMCQGTPGEVLAGESLARTFGAGKMVYHHPHTHFHGEQPTGNDDRGAPK